MNAELSFKRAVPLVSATPVAGATVRRHVGAGTPGSVEKSRQSVEAVSDLLRAGRQAYVSRVSAEVTGE